MNSSDEVTAYTVDETTSKETWKAGISSSGIVDYDVNIGTYYRLASGTNLDVDDVKSQYEKYRDEEFRSFTWLENEFDTWKTGSEDKAIGYSYGASAPKNFNVLYINKSSNKTSYEILSGVDEVSLDFKLEELFTLMSDDLKGWHVFTPDDPTDPSSVIENYNPDYSGTAEYAGTKEGLKQAYNDWNNTPTDNMFIGGMFESSTTYTVQYNQNLPTGYTLSDGITWYTDSTTTDLTGSPIILQGSADMTCEDTSGNTRTLQGWNTYSSGAGSSYSFGASINTDAGFIGGTLTLYAMWSDPVAPTTGFMYWKVDGDDNNKTIHYYASPGEGRAAVVIGTNGVEHTSLGSSDREKIKYAVFEDNIAATNLECCFENFKGLESITNLGKLDTSNVTSMRQMFNFAGVKELDLTKFETSNVTDMYGMFSSCEHLETIRVSNKFVVDNVSTSNGKFMFSGCEKLVGEKGTKFTDTVTPWGKSYAHIDEGSTNPGLFSGASTPPTTYTVKYNQDLPTGYTLSGGMTWYTDSTTTDLTGSPIILKGSADMTCEDTSGNVRTLQSWNTQIEHKGNTFNFGAEFKDSQYFDPDPTCTLYAMWSDPVAPGPTPPGPTPPGPTPPSPGGGGTGGGTSGGGSSDPAHGPMGDLTKEMQQQQQQQQQQQKATDKKQARKAENKELADLLKSYNENHNSPMVNARDDSGNVGHGQWLRIPGSTIWYFLTSDFNQNANSTEGFLVDGWFNLGWDGVDRWYRFDENGIMLMGWWIEDGKTYFLQTDENDNWYGKAMTGTQVIDGVTYNFDENGVLIQ